MVSVIIVNWNGIYFIQKCLDGLRAQTCRDFSIIMVDNASQDRSLEIVQKKYPEVKILAQSENIGFSAANNIAIKSKSTEYVALINNDAVPHPDWLQNLMDALENHPEAGFCASKMLFYDNPGVIDRAGDIYTTAGTALLRGRGEPSKEFNSQERVFGACAGAALYRTQMLDDIGLFDEDFFLVYEDVDLSSGPSCEAISAYMYRMRSFIITPAAASVTILLSRSITVIVTWNGYIFRTCPAV